MLRTLLLVGVAPVLCAQSFGRLRSGFTPGDTVIAAAAAAADFDGDGDLDVVVHAGLPEAQLFRNDGEGRFAREPLAVPLGNDVMWFTAVDIDHDGDQDVLVARRSIAMGCNTQDLLLRNDGVGRFDVIVLDNGPGNTQRFVPVDFDQDGDVDLVDCNRGVLFCSAQPARLLRNDGTDAFSEATSLFSPTPPLQATSAAAVDVQGDGLVDLVFDGAPLQVYLQATNGSFVRTASAIPHPLAGVQAVDVDGDQDIDFVGTDAGLAKVVRNDGGGVYSTWTVPQVAASWITPADIDGDSDVDLLITFGMFNEGTSLWRQDAGMQFTDVTATQLGTIGGGGVAPGLFLDCDDDGDVDLLGRDTSLLHNDGNGSFLRLEPWPFTNPDRGVLVDVDGDGRLDVIGLQSTIGWWRNDGADHFVLQANLPGSSDGRVMVRLDIEGDGDLDVFASGCSLLRNNGNGTFTNITSTALPAVAQQSTAIALAGDLDGDGDVDLFLGHDVPVLGGTRDTVLRNNGNGVFTDVTVASLVDPYLTFDADLLDHDGDGDLDLVMATTTGIVRMFANNGSGGFQDVTTSRLPPATTGRQVVAFDFDGDHDLDLVTGDYAPLTGRLLRNDNGTFTDVSARLPAGNQPYDPLIADIDDDGDLDVRLSGRWYGNEQGGFRPLASSLPVPYSQQGLKRLVDIDDDRDPDFFDGTRNLHRHLENALPPRLGFHGELRLHARPNTTDWTPLAMLFLATAAATPALPIPPFGTLRLDPTTLVLHSVHTIGTDGPATLRYICPSTPALLGTTLWTQALFLNGPRPAHWHLSGIVPLPVRR